MALLAGKNATIKIGSNVVANMVSYSFVINNETIDAPVFDSDWVKSIGGIQSWSCSISGFLDLDSTANISFRTAAESHTMLTDLGLYVDATHFYSPDTSTDAEAGCWIEGLTIGADNNSIVSFEATIKGNGPVVYA